MYYEHFFLLSSFLNQKTSKKSKGMKKFLLPHINYQTKCHNIVTFLPLVIHIGRNIDNKKPLGRMVYYVNGTPITSVRVIIHSRA